MKNVNRLTIVTIILNFFILVAGGHGIGFLGLIEFFCFPEFFNGNRKFSLFGNYNDRLFTAATLAIVGQIILSIAYLKKVQVQKFTITYLGLFILLFSYFILTMDFYNSTIDGFSFWAGIPFLVFAIILLIRTIKNHKLTLTTE